MPTTNKNTLFPIDYEEKHDARHLSQDQDTLEAEEGRKQEQRGGSPAETGREEGEEEEGYCPAAYPELGHHEDALREPTSASSPPRATRRIHWTPAPHRRKQPTDLQHAVGGRVDLTSEALPSECRLKNLSSSRVVPASFRVGRPWGGARTNTFIYSSATPSVAWDPRALTWLPHRASGLLSFVHSQSVTGGARRQPPVSEDSNHPSPRFQTNSQALGRDGNHPSPRALTLPRRVPMPLPSGSWNVAPADYSSMWGTIKRHPTSGSTCVEPPSTFLPCVLSKGSVSATPPRLWPAAPLTVTR